jgi:protein-tyrosine phosphatase
MGRHRLVVDDEAGEFRLLFVCTGNVCRSPFAEILTRHLLSRRLGDPAATRFPVSSAGVRAVAGAPMHAHSRDQLAHWGLDGAAADRFVARQLTPTLIGAADLVLGASPRHRSAAVQLDPGALATAFSVREFARLIGAVELGGLPADPVARARALVEEARQVRGLVPLFEPDGDRVPDPIAGPSAAHREAARLLAGAAGVIVDAIVPAQ